MTPPSTYPVVFASPRRDSAIPAVTAAVGGVDWSREIGKAASPDSPPAVLIRGDDAAVVTYSDLVLFDRDGNRRWERQKQGGTPVAVAQGNLYFKDGNQFLYSVDRDNAVVLGHAPFPWAMSEQVLVFVLWPRETDFIAAVFYPGAGERADGDPPDTPLAKPKLTGLRNNYGTTYGDWGESYEGRPRLPPLLLPETGRLTLATDEVFRLDVAQETEVSRFRLPPEVNKLVDWSVDGNEVYCLAGYADGHKILLALSAEGKELWRWTDPEHPDAWARRQPPIRARDGRVYALTDGRVLAIEQGRLIWQYDLASESLRHGALLSDGSFEVKDGRLLSTGKLRHGSALADGSLLVTASKTLYHLDAAGRKRFSVTLDKDILSPPAVDAGGGIYVATATHLLRIR